MNQDLPPLGSIVGPWHILTRLDSGSFGVVYRAQRAGHPDSPPVALKVARRPKDPRFGREAELLQLGIPGAPRFEDEGLWTAPSGERYPYVVMELVQGSTLYNWFQGGRTSREVLEVLAQVAGALASAHARDAVHRDVKGDNIRVTPEGRAVLVDWGSGWFSGARPLTDTVPPPGTTPYRPPEQRAFSYRFRMDSEARWQAQPTDDLYSLGVAFYRCVTGLYLTPFSVLALGRPMPRSRTQSSVGRRASPAWRWRSTVAAGLECLGRNRLAGRRCSNTKGLATSPPSPDRRRPPRGSHESPADANWDFLME